MFFTIINFRSVLIFFLIFLVVPFASVKSYTMDDEKFYEDFISDLINNNENIEKYFLFEDLEKSNRLSISYDNVKYKFLLTYDIDEFLKKEIIKNKFPYEISFRETGEEFSELDFTCEKIQLTKKYYFKNKKLIFPSTYYADNWNNFKSEYFSFYISDPDLFNVNCPEYLDMYVSELLVVMNFSKEERELLKKEKIIYLLCKDENEIKKISGFSTKGIYLLDEDAVITTYSFHTHEIVHLLMNYKLKNLPIFTLPFFQEGIAVALGGRGGLGSSVLMDAGYFILKSDFADTKKILSKKGFQSDDPSITYPVSGFVNKYLIDKNGIDNYLKLYLEMSGSNDFVNSLSTESIIRKLNLNEFSDNIMKEYKYADGIEFDKELNNESYKLIYRGNYGEVYGNSNYYFFKLSSSVFIKNRNSDSEYKSKLFAELFPDRKYKGECFMIKFTSDEIKLYNFVTNELTASYDTGFMLTKKEFNGEFFISRKLIPVNLEKIIIAD